MKDAQRDVTAFHEAMGCGISDRAAPGFSNVELRLRLIDEEVRELHDAVEEMHCAAPPTYAPLSKEQAFVNAVDALADIAYVVIGTAVEWGVDLAAVWAAVHAANMAKVGGGRRADGKIGKPEGWTPPDIAGVLRRQVEDARSAASRCSNPECHCHFPREAP
jgi:predicted HAD superfamily Cof-like phosphohydrolase